ncbi:MAG: LuxR C-terminal-related transcriptional regulator [Motiliproteus sp.]
MNLMLISDSPLFLQGLEISASKWPDNLHILKVGTPSELQSHARRYAEVDLFVLDLSGRAITSQGVLLIRQGYPCIAFSRDHSAISMRSGLSGNLDPDTERLASHMLNAACAKSTVYDCLDSYRFALDLAQRDARGPLSWIEFSRGEGRVLAALNKGMSNGEIALSLNLSKYTVKVHVSRIFKKVGVTSRMQLVALKPFREAS